MPHHTGFGIVLFQSFQKFLQGILLLRCTGICRKSPFIETALVADADGIAVIPRDNHQPPRLQTQQIVQDAHFQGGSLLQSILEE